MQPTLYNSPMYFFTFFLIKLLIIRFIFQEYLYCSIFRQRFLFFIINFVKTEISSGYLYHEKSIKCCLFKIVFLLDIF